MTSCHFPFNVIIVKLIIKINHLHICYNFLYLLSTDTSSSHILIHIYRNQLSRGSSLYHWLKTSNKAIFECEFSFKTICGLLSFKIEVKDYLLPFVRILFANTYNWCEAINILLKSSLEKSDISFHIKSSPNKLFPFSFSLMGCPMSTLYCLFIVPIISFP